MTYVFGTLLTANGSMKLLNLTAALGIVVNLAVNFILIPRMQARGAAIASLSTQSVMALIQTVIAFRQLQIPMRNFPIFRAVIFTVLLVPGVLLVHRSFTGSALAGLIIGGVYAFVVAFATRLIPLRFWRDFSSPRG
jgi:O-antigen/teichoic acid export membrane protein